MVGVLELLWQGALELLYPENLYCAACGDTIDPDMPYSLCGRCVREIHWMSEDLCRDGRSLGHLFCRASACAIYESRTKEMLKRFKYGGQPQLSKSLGRLMVRRLERDGTDGELVVPVPMHKQKERVRGYNQAALLAKEVAAGLSIPCFEDGLIRVKGTGAMSVLSAEERHLNLNHAIEVAPMLIEEGLLENRRVLLVDDILTTGTTADQCCGVLLEAGARKVDLLVFASGEML